MLGVTLWLVIAIGLLATLLLDAAAGFGHATLHAAAGHAIEGAMHDAVADYQNTLQSGAARSAPPGALHRTYPSAPAETAGTPGFTIAYDVTPTTLVAPSCALAAAEPGSPRADALDAIGWLQCNGFVAESRISLRVVVRVLDAAGGAALATREQFVTLRLFGEPPYSAVVGRKDASAGDPAAAGALAAPAHEGDVGGDTLSGGIPAPAASPWPAGGTLIHVRYECHDGAGSCANAAPPDPDGDLRAGVRWANGNRPPP
ncbi:MAG TPA: hypothetical protein VGC96_03025 [Candidatus Elarobacter sp.]|jgi:hypothetical protein